MVRLGPEEPSLWSFLDHKNRPSGLFWTTRTVPLVRFLWYTEKKGGVQYGIYTSEKTWIRSHASAVK